MYFKVTRGFDIINNSEFTDANKVFGAKCVDLKRQALAKAERKPPICEEDLKKLYESTDFVWMSQKSFKSKVLFEVMLYFCRRERQNFSFDTDSTGARYLCKATDELTKTAGKLTKVSMEV